MSTREDKSRGGLLKSMLAVFGFRRTRKATDFAEEIQAHIALETEALRADGRTEREAQTLAKRTFGNVTQAEEAFYESSRWLWLDHFVQDLRYALRGLWKSPAFSLAAGTTLALAIGANTAIFSVVDAVLLRPLPFKDSDKLVVVTERNVRAHVDQTGVPYPSFREWATENHTFEEMAAYWNVKGDGVVLGGIASAERIRFSIVTENFFSILGIAPAAGREFLAPEQEPGNGHVFLASDALWRRSLGGKPDAIGKSFLLDGQSFTLIGVLPAGLEFPQNCDIWIPRGFLTLGQLNDRISHPFGVLGRRKPGESVSQSELELNRLQDRSARGFSNKDADWKVTVRPLMEEYVGNVRASLVVLSWAVGFILLIACANVANLLLARSISREREFAVRTALGASRSRLLRQTLTESLLLVSVSTVLALVLARFAMALILALSAGSINRMEPFQWSWPVLAFTAGLIVVTTVLVGLVPALRISGSNSEDALRDGQRSGMTGIRNVRFRGALVVVEISLTLVLLCGAGLLLKSFLALRSVDPGFNPDHIVTMKIALPDAQYPKVEQRSVFLNRVLDRVKAIPGVQVAAATDNLPFNGQSNWDSINIEGRPALDWSQAPSVELRNVSADYFRAMGIARVRGKDFSEYSARDASHIVMINQAMATKFWPGKDPVGQRLTILDERPRSREVIGIVADVKHFGLDRASEAEIYTPPSWWSVMNLVIRAQPEGLNLVPTVRSAVAALDRSVPVYDASTMDRSIDHSVASRRLNLLLFLYFAGLAMILSAVGLYGLLAFTMARRIHEIGLRMALGAERGRIVGFVLWHGMRLTLLGLAAGILGSLVLTRLMKALLYGVSASDPSVFAVVVLSLAGVGALACGIPAWRATRIDPMAALRAE